MIKISIVIPVYNEASALRTCLKSIAQQTVVPFEVIIVDNNSTDNSVAVAKSFDFVRVVSESKQGVVYSRSKGFDAANGDVIARIDADSVLPDNWISHIIDFYSQDNHKLVAFSGGANFYNVRFPHAVAWLYNFLAFDFNHVLIGHPTLWGSNMALKREQWRAVRKNICKRPDIHEDLDLAMHLVEQGYRIYYDRRFRIGAHLRRVRSNRHELWEYLQWWPRTLRLHRRWTWVICWVFGCLMLYLITPILSIAERVARLFGRAPLAEN